MKTKSKQKALQDEVDSLIRKRMYAEEAGDAEAVAFNSDANIAACMCTTVAYVRSRLPHVQKTWAKYREMGI